jgi:hypothetical protein
MGFQGQTGTREVTRDNLTWDPTLNNGSGGFVKNGTTTTTEKHTGSDNVVTPTQFGGTPDRSAALVADANKQAGGWRDRSAPWRTDFTTGQQGFIGQLGQRAAGVAGPTAAENQLTANAAAGQRAQFALAQSQRGAAGIANAGATAANQSVMGGQQAANQLVQLQANQQQQAQQQYGQALNQFRGQNAQQTMADEKRRNDMVKFYTQLGFDEQQANLMAAQQIDQMNADIWAKQMGYDTSDYITGEQKKQQSADDENSYINAGVQAAASLGGAMGSAGGGK